MSDLNLLDDLLSEITLMERAEIRNAVRYAEMNAGNAPAISERDHYRDAYIAALRQVESVLIRTRRYLATQPGKRPTP